MPTTLAGMKQPVISPNGRWQFLFSPESKRTTIPGRPVSLLGDPHNGLSLPGYRHMRGTPKERPSKTWTAPSSTMMKN
jgi:hypothetical protein